MYLIVVVIVVVVIEIIVIHVIDVRRFVTVVTGVCVRCSTGWKWVQPVR